MMIRNMTIRMKQFCKDQGGMEALQTVCIVAIAATVMIGAAKMGTEGTAWMNKNWTEMKNTSDEGLKASLQNAASEAAGEAAGDAFDAATGFLPD
jgi:hypothetical protein